MDIIVKDTNIIIDLINIGLEGFCRLLEVEFHTTLHVIREIKEPSQRQKLTSMVLEGKLIVDEFTPIEYERLLDMLGTYSEVNNLSDADWSVIILAERYKCRLLTSDRRLKRQAESYGLKVNGLLWIVDALVEKGIIKGQDMIPYLERYRDTNERAPQNEIKRLMEKYKE